MPIREVANQRDVRAPRLLPSSAQLFSVHFLQRAVSVATLVTIDVASLLVATLVVPAATGLAWVAGWPGLTWRDTILESVVVVMAGATRGLYGRRFKRHTARGILTTWVIAFVVTTVLMLFVDPVGIGARWVLVWMVASALALLGRYLFDALLHRVFGAYGDAPPVLLLGMPADCRYALQVLSCLAPADRVSVVGLVTPDPVNATDATAAGLPPIVGSQNDLGAALSTTGATQLILTNPASLNGQLTQVMDVCHCGGVALKLVTVGTHAPTDAVGYVPGMDCPLFVVRPQPAGPVSYLVKAVADRVAAALLLALLSPLLLGIAALIKVTSHGPVLFVDDRVGVGQRSFRFYKFRTMTPDARESQAALESRNEADGVLFKVHDDPRITRVGRILRRLSLDELPQLANVLKGDMSLVGPRPLPLRDCELMEEWHRRRHVMLPGITGLWQVSGRSDLSFDDMVRLDLKYMETWSLKTDLYILWRTAGAVIHARGAY